MTTTEAIVDVLKTAFICGTIVGVVYMFFSYLIDRKEDE